MFRAVTWARRMLREAKFGRTQARLSLQRPLSCVWGVAAIFRGARGAQSGEAGSAGNVLLRDGPIFLRIGSMELLLFEAYIGLFIKETFTEHTGQSPVPGP